MNWKDNVRIWRSLSPTEQQRLRLERSPVQVWQSMAFEREPVSLAWLQRRHERLTTPPAASKPPSGD